MLEIKNKEYWYGYSDSGLANEPYFDGYSEGYRQSMTNGAVMYYRFYQKNQNKENGMLALAQDMMEEISRFEKLYGNLSAEKLCEIINLESEYLVSIRFD